VENKMNSQSANAWPWAVTEYAYDPSGKRVMKETNPDPLDRNDAYNPAWEFYFYSITGQKLVTMDCNDPTGITLPSCWVVAENTYFGSKMLVSNGVYIVTDRLGSVRANTQGESFAYYPYGEERTNRPDGRDKFATYFRDAVGQDYAGQRYYGAGMGRFWSPDPGGIKTARASDPTSWNRYAYVGGDPVNRFDPSGSYWCYADGDDDPKTCKMAGFGVMTGYNSSYEETESSGTIQTGDGAVMPGEGTAEPDCSSQFGGSWSLWSGFVTAHYSDTVSLGKAADLPNDWIMAWASVESAWGQGAVTQATGNYFGWASVGDIPCAGGAATFHNDGCFSSFEASAMTALFSTNNRFNYGGYTGISSAAILSDNAYDGAAAAFQALANAGYNTNPVNGPKYGATIGSRVGLIDKAEDCLRTKGEIQ
jgi:RHS repeat-associated protein